MTRRHLLLGILGGLASSSSEPLIGIDHIPFVVADLDAAAQTYRRLGFVIKPGRFHADGIRNEHVKFEDGAGLELITAPAATDALTTQYRHLLTQGEGPAFVGFRTSSQGQLTDALTRGGVGFAIDDGQVLPTHPALQWLFMFEGTNRSPTDRPEYFAHPNSADATLAVWIAGVDQPEVLNLFTALGARIQHRKVYAPDLTTATVATVANGEVIFLPVSRQVISGRPIVGVVFRIHNLVSARRALQSAGVKRPSEVSTADYRSLFAPPGDTRGAWIEFREPRGRMT